VHYREGALISVHGKRILRGKDQALSWRGSRRVGRKKRKWNSKKCISLAMKEGVRTGEKKAKKFS